MVRTEEKIAGVSIIIEDYATRHRLYTIQEYVVQYLRFVPQDDLPERLTVRLFDTIPSHIQDKDVCAAFYPELKTNGGAWIDIYLCECLGCFPRVSDEHKILGVWLNRAFLFLFGKFFLAAAIFHEIGHLKHFHALSPVCHPDEKEEEAARYENTLLGSAFPFLRRHYSLFNWTYKVLYGRRISVTSSLL